MQFINNSHVGVVMIIDSASYRSEMPQKAPQLRPSQRERHPGGSGGSDGAGESMQEPFATVVLQANPYSVYLGPDAGASYGHDGTWSLGAQARICPMFTNLLLARLWFLGLLSCSGLVSSVLWVLGGPEAKLGWEVQPLHMPQQKSSKAVSIFSHRFRVINLCGAGCCTPAARGRRRSPAWSRRRWHPSCGQMGDSMPGCGSFAESASCPEHGGCMCESAKILCKSN